MAGNRNPPSKKRSIAFIGQTKGIVSQLTVTHDEATGELRLVEVDPSSLRIEHFYERDSGKEKTLLSAPASHSDTRFSYLESLRRDFDYLVAIDTNSRAIAGRRVSVVVAFATPLLSEYSTQIPFDLFAAYAILDASQTINPERIGWHLILQHHVDPVHRAKRLRVGVVVDSELGLLPRMNARTECYYDNHLVPPYVKLIYASDAAADNLPSQMIRYCNKHADKTLEQLASRPSSLNATPNGDRHFHAYARIHFREAT